MIKVFYIVNVYDEDILDISDTTEFNTDRDIHAVKGGYDDLELGWLIKDICKDFYRDGGWEIADTWQNEGITVALWDDKEQFVGKFETHLEFEPYFNVSQL